jgi:hypothetical protein
MLAKAKSLRKSCLLPAQLLHRSGNEVIELLIRHILNLERLTPKLSSRGCQT